MIAVPDPSGNDRQTGPVRRAQSGAPSAAPACIGPKPHLLRGHLPELTRNPTGFLTRCAREHGDVVPLRFGPKRAILVSAPALIEQVLVTDRRSYVKPFVLRVDRASSGRPPDSDDDVWRRPQLAQQAFHRSAVAAYGETMVATTERMLASWREGEPRDVIADMMRLTLVIVADTLFGADISADTDTVREALAVVIDSLLPRLSSVIPGFHRLPTPSARRLRRATRQLHAVMDDLIRQQRASGGKAGGLLSMLGPASGVGTDPAITERVRSEALTFLIAGHETTALAMSWMWYLLAGHPAVEAKLVAELQTVLGGRAPTAADRPQLAYTEMIVSEALRLYPPLWLMARAAGRDAELGGRHVPAGMLLLLSPWVLQRDPRFFDEPERFMPERWADGFAQRLPRYAYFPFGGGSRGCIGSGFAMMEMVLLLATIAQQFRLTLAPGQAIRPRAAITLRPSPGLTMDVHRR